MMQKILKKATLIILILFALVHVYFFNLHMVSVDTNQIQYKVNSDHLIFQIDKVEVRNFEKKQGIIGNEYQESSQWANITQIKRKWGYYPAITYALVSNFYSKPKVFHKNGNIIEINGAIRLISGYDTIDQNLLRTNSISIKGISSKFELINSSYDDYVHFKCIGKPSNNFRLDQPIELIINNKVRSDKKNLKVEPNWIPNNYYSYGLFDFSDNPNETIINYLSRQWYA